MPCFDDPKYHVIDEHEGTIICTECNRVIDVHYVYNGIITNEYKISFHHNEIKKMGENRHINSNIIAEAFRLFDESICKLSDVSFDNTHKYAYCLYKAGRNLKNEYDIFEICEFFNCNSKKINAIDMIYSDNITPVFPGEILERVLSPYYCRQNSLLQYRDICEIKQYCEKINLSRNSKTIAACCFYYFLEKHELLKKFDLCLNKIAILFRMHARTLNSNMKQFREILSS